MMEILWTPDPTHSAPEAETAALHGHRAVVFRLEGGDDLYPYWFQVETSPSHGLQLIGAESGFSTAAKARMAAEWWLRRLSRWTEGEVEEEYPEL